MTSVDSAVWFAVSLVTLLGDPLVLAGLGVIVFWAGDRLPKIGDRLDPARRALAFAALVGGLALTAGLKAFFARPRLATATDLPGVAGMPDALVPIYTWIVGPGGHAFPSGHAAAATLGWLGLAWAVTDDGNRRPLLVGGVLAGAIAGSRIALGVHRPIEVAAGIGLGVAVLVVVFEVLGRPRPAFVLTGLVGTGIPVVVALETEGTVGTAVALGSAIGWELSHGRGRVAMVTATLAASAIVGVAFVREGAVGTAPTLLGLGGGVAIVVIGAVLSRNR